MKAKSRIIILFFFVHSMSFGQDFSLYKKIIYTNSDGKSMPCRVLTPKKIDKNKRYPLVVFLHGSGERGNDNEKQLTHGASLFLSEENRNQYPSYVIFPQCPEGESWTTIKLPLNPDEGLKYGDIPSQSLQLVIGLIQHYVNTEKVDDKRIYVSGLSLGGMGTFELAYRFPAALSVAMPICGAGVPKSFDERVSKIAFWVFHGDQDPVVAVKYSRQMVARLKELNNEVLYSEYKGVNHESWNNAFAEKDFMKWMFSHHRD